MCAACQICLNETAAVPTHCGQVRWCALQAPKSIAHVGSDATGPSERKAGPCIAGSHMQGTLPSMRHHAQHRRAPRHSRGTARLWLPHALPARRHATIACAAAGPQGAFDEPTAAATRQKLFNDIAPAYDELNDLLSLGQHRVWKRMAVRWSGAAPGHAALDVCCGSGDLALLLERAVATGGTVVGLDFAQDMLDFAARRRLPGDARGANGVEWLQGDALAMPFADASFDAATMGFGLRNVADIPQALRELHRVLRPGARVAILDFNNSANALVDGVQVRALLGLIECTFVYAWSPNAVCPHP